MGKRHKPEEIVGKLRGAGNKAALTEDIRQYGHHAYRRVTALMCNRDQSTPVASGEMICGTPV